MDDTDLIDALTEIDLFDGLEVAQVEGIVRAGGKRQLAAGEVLTEPGSVDAHLWAFLGGELRIESEDGALLVKISKPRVLGEMGVLLGEMRTSRVVAVKPSDLFEVPLAELQAFVESEPDVGQRLLGNLCRILYGRLHATNRDFGALRRQAEALRARLTELAPDDPLLRA